MEKAVVYSIGNHSDERDEKTLKELLDPNENEFVNIVRRIEDEHEKATFIQFCISTLGSSSLYSLDDEESELIENYRYVDKNRDKLILLGMFKRMVEENICNEYK